jgi:Predicted AdoMet-dependent methyltransferase
MTVLLITRYRTVLLITRYRHNIINSKKYKHWIDDWNESQDPLKDVFEEISIAAFLILLFENQKTTRTFKFVDLGMSVDNLIDIIDNLLTINIKVFKS